MEQLIRQVIATLDQIEVKGKDNMDKLLGSMQALEKVADAMRYNREQLAKLKKDERSDGNGDVQESD